MAIRSSWGLALIIGATAAIAVPPQIAAPAESKKAIRRWMPRDFSNAATQQKKKPAQTEKSKEDNSALTLQCIRQD